MDTELRYSDYHILVVDDDEHIADLVALYLRNASFQVECAGRGEAALSAVDSGHVSLLVLDIMLPDMDGWTVCRRVREIADIPILMVTAKGESSDKLRGFGLGADDYLVKPFDPNELVARVKSLLRRSYRSPARDTPQTRVQFDSLCVDTRARTVTVRDRPVDLTKREYQLLEIFVQNPNHILDRQQLLDLVWGIDYVGDDRVVDGFVKRLRQKLGRDREKWSIVTVRGLGYKFQVEGV